MNESGRQHRREEEEEEEEEEEGEDDLKQDIYDFNVVVFISAASRYPIPISHQSSAGTMFRAPCTLWKEGGWSSVTRPRSAATRAGPPRACSTG